MTPPRPTRAFTLLELLVVVGLISAFAAVVMSSLGSSSKGAALATAQVNLSNLIVTARTRAVATSRSVRIVMHSDVNDSEKYLRYFVLQEADAAGTTWTSRAELFLPAGVYVLPQSSKTVTGTLEGNTTWKKSDGVTVLHSSVFSDPLFAAPINSTSSENWDALVYNARGVSTNSGFLVLATGLPRTPGTYAAGESPVQLSNQDLVRGFSISSYGMPTLLNGRDAF